MRNHISTSLQREQHAIVIGGGIAGLLTARILADTFARVTLIERDRYPNEPDFRAGIPQGRHVHLMLFGGKRLLEEIFPDIQKKLALHGATTGDITQECAIRGTGGWQPRPRSHLSGFFCSRPLLEWLVRQEIASHPSISIKENYEVIGLTATPDATRITGVQIRERGPGSIGERATETVSGELVVDASGRNSHAPHWLTALGYTPPEEIVVNAHLGYATRLYAPPKKTFDWRGVIIQSNPPRSLRSGVLWTIEGGRWLVGLGGAGGDYPPTDENTFIEYTKSLPSPLIYEAIKEAEPLSQIYGYRRTENRLRLYDKLRRQPEGFIVLGDAACAFNPIYGQGMAVAAMGAITLRELLQQHTSLQLDGFARSFQRRLAQINRVPWQLASAADYRVPGVEGSNPGRLAPLLNGYFNRLGEVVSYHPLAHRNFAEVLHLTRNPVSLFHPSIALAVLRHKPGRVKVAEQPPAPEARIL